MPIHHTSDADLSAVFRPIMLATPGPASWVAAEDVGTDNPEALDDSAAFEDAVQDYGAGPHEPTSPVKRGWKKKHCKKWQLMDLEALSESGAPPFLLRTLPFNVRVVARDDSGLPLVTGTGTVMQYGLPQAVPGPSPEMDMHWWLVTNTHVLGSCDPDPVWLKNAHVDFFYEAQAPQRSIRVEVDMDSLAKSRPGSWFSPSPFTLNELKSFDFNISKAKDDLPRHDIVRVRYVPPAGRSPRTHKLEVRFQRLSSAFVLR
jgi:hypothetical protein